MFYLLQKIRQKSIIFWHYYELQILPAVMNESPKKWETINKSRELKLTNWKKNYKW